MDLLDGHAFQRAFRFRVAPGESRKIDAELVDVKEEISEERGINVLRLGTFLKTEEMPQDRGKVPNIEKTSRRVRDTLSTFLPPFASSQKRLLLL